MKLKRIIPLFLAFLLLSVQADEETEKLVEWDADQPLTWNDFSGKIDSESPFDAWTWSGINYVYSWNYEGTVIKVDLNAYAFFDPEQSWVKKSEKTPELLAHEQLHFNLSELHCRYFEEAVRNFSFTENIETEIDSLYNAHLQELLSMQIQYDEETEHHQNKEGQAKWQKFVTDELETLK